MKLSIFDGQASLLIYRRQFEAAEDNNDWIEKENSSFVGTTRLSSIAVGGYLRTESKELSRCYRLRYRDRRIKVNSKLFNRGVQKRNENFQEYGTEI